MLQAHSCLQPLNNSLSYHPQVGQRKHHQQLAGVLGQAPLARPAMTELTLNHPKRMLHLGADASLELFKLIRQCVADSRFVQRLALARHHRNLPVHISVLVLNLLAHFNALVARVGKHNFFLSVQQGMRLRHLVCIGRSRRHRVNQSRLGVHANVSFLAKVPLVALLCLVHLRIALTCAFLGGAWCRYQSGVHDGAGHEQQPAINQLGIERRQYLHTQVIFLKHVPRAQGGAFIGQPGDACAALGKLTVHRDVVQSFFHCRIRVPEELPQQIDAMHHLGGKRWTPPFCQPIHE